MWNWIVNHNVWNKVVAAGLITGLGFLISFIYSLFTDQSFTALFTQIIFYKIPFWIIFITFFVMIILIGIYNAKPAKIKLSSEEKSLQEKKKEFIKFYNKLIDEDNQITFRFTTYFHSTSGLPQIYNFKVYCNKHPVPVEFYGSNCSDRGCENSRIHMNMAIAQRNAESQLLYYWEK